MSLSEDHQESIFQTPPRGVTSLGSKSLVSVEYISGSRGGSLGQFVRPRRLLGKVGRNLSV